MHLAMGKLPESNWVRVRGRLLWDHCAVEEGRTGNIQAFFVPLVTGSWQPNEPFYVLVRISQFEAEKMQDSGTVEGLIQPFGLPIDLRIAFSGDDGPPAAENLVYIHHGTNPASQRKFAMVVMGIGFAGLVGSVLLFKLGGKDSPASSTYHSRAQARDLNEVAPKTAEQEQQQRAQVAQRDNEIDRWMREHGLKKDEPAAAPPENAEHEVAAMS
jgi:hypothetical protein